MQDVRKMVITGVVPPDVDEARIREAWPSVARSPGMASLGRVLTRTIVLAPLAWLIMSLGYFGKVLPFAPRRYTLTNRRLMIQRGLKPSPIQEIALSDIDEVRLPPDSVDSFYRSGDLEIVSRGEVKMRLAGVPEPESFQRAILNATSAWAGKIGEPFLSAAGTTKG